MLTCLFYYYFLANGVTVQQTKDGKEQYSNIGGHNDKEFCKYHSRNKNYKLYRHFEKQYVILKQHVENTRSSQVLKENFERNWTQKKSEVVDVPAL